ncbi:MAG TPA: site-specific integrase [Ktedonobacterales bacterium]|nr:site-specific integrase [Ktedonobacterales bacterium]
MLGHSKGIAHCLALLQRAGLPRIRPHDLRHTAATLLLARGVPVKVVSEMLGHASVGITLSIYGHVLPPMQGLRWRAGVKSGVENWHATPLAQYMTD